MAYSPPSLLIQLRLFEPEMRRIYLQLLEFFVELFLFLLLQFLDQPGSLAISSKL